MLLPVPEPPCWVSAGRLHGLRILWAIIHAAIFFFAGAALRMISPLAGTARGLLHFDSGASVHRFLYLPKSFSNSLTFATSRIVLARHHQLLLQLTSKHSLQLPQFFCQFCLLMPVYYVLHSLCFTNAFGEAFSSDHGQGCSHLLTHRMCPSSSLLTKNNSTGTL